MSFLNNAFNASWSLISKLLIIHWLKSFPSLYGTLNCYIYWACCALHTLFLWLTWLRTGATCLTHHRFTMGFQIQSLEATAFWPQSLCFSTVTHLGAQGGNCYHAEVGKKSSYRNIALLSTCHQSWSCRGKWNEQKTGLWMPGWGYVYGESKDSSHLKNMNGC